MSYDSEQLLKILAEANQYSENGYYDEAIKLYALYLSHNPNDVAVRQQLDSAKELSKAKASGGTGKGTAGKSSVGIVVGVLVVLVLLGGAGFGYYYYSNFMNKEKKDKKEVVDNKDNEKTSDDKQQKDDKQNDSDGKKQDTDNDNQSEQDYDLTDLFEAANNLVAEKNIIGALNIYDIILEKEPANEVADSKAAECRQIIKSAKTLKAKKGTDGKYGFVDGKGNLVIDYKYEMAMNTQNRLTPFMVNKQWGFINSQGKEIIKPTYHRIEAYQDGYKALIQGNLKEFYIVEKDAGVSIKAL